MARLDNLDYEVNGVTTNYEIVPEIAPLFNATTAYAAGDTVIKDGHLYRFNTAHAAGAWIGTDADEITVGEELTSHGADITELKADLSELETDIETGNLTAGTAKQLLSDEGMTDKSPYLFRAMPTGAGDREEPVIVGGSVVWNQQAYNGNFDSSDGWRAYSSSYGSVSVENNIATLTYSQAGTGGYNFGLYQGSKATFIKTHKYLVRALVNPSFAMSTKCELGGSDVGLAKPATANTWNTFEDILNAGANGSTFIIKPVGLPNITVGDNIQFKKIVISDLTVMFGSAVADYVYALESATAGAGIAWLKKYGFFTQDYYPYSEPTFKHVEGLASHKMTGFNQLDIDRTLGTLSGSSNTTVRSFAFDKYYVGLSYNNYYDPSKLSEYHVNNPVGEIGHTTTYNAYGVAFPIKVVPNTTYYCEVTTVKGSPNIGVGFYDADGNPLGFMYGVSNNTFTTPANCHIATIVVYGNTSGGIAVKDICIHLHWDGERDGEYEAYKEYTYPLDDSLTLRGIPKLDASNNLYFDGDTYEADGTVTRKYGIVDLGTLNWSALSTPSDHIFRVHLTDAKAPSLNSTPANAICPKYVLRDFTSLSASTDKQCAIGLAGETTPRFVVVDSSYSSVDDFETAMSGVYLLYEKATTTTETADPYAPLQLADPYGTEEWVLADGAFPMPVGQETFYPENLRAKIEGLPWNFSSLIAPTETTLTATRAYTAGQLFIVDNVLYQATTSIASGGTITPGTNCTATTLAEVISAL